MNPNFTNPYIYPLYMPCNNHEAYHRFHHWSHHSFTPAVRGNLVHVNPAFLKPPSAPVAQQATSNKIIVNPRFFPQVYDVELQSNVNPTQAPTLGNRDSHSRQAVQELADTAVLPPSEKSKPISQPPRFKIKTKLKVINVPGSGVTSTLRPPEETEDKISPISKPLNSPVNSKPSPIMPSSRLVRLSPKLKLLQKNLKNKYQWKKGESPLKPVLLKNAYKLIRKSSPSKSPRVSLSLKIPPPFNGLVILTPPKLASTPIQRGGVFSRFKLDNRARNKKRPTKPAFGVLNKLLKNKFKLDRSSKTSKPYSPIVIRAGHTFSNFNTFNKSLLNRSKAQRAINRRKATKSPKKSKASAKAKKNNRYYDSDMKVKPDEEMLEDIEIVANSSGRVARAPIGTLPSYITL